ncbi:MAG: Rrf2 family transcriptional regulator, partial [Longimicrobiales bacterium]|nr:Rrf2 family transcriptional regulator [Longimicrobiales bacterium]
PAGTVVAADTIYAQQKSSMLQSGVLLSERGRSGGFRLARDPSDIPLLAVVGTFDDIGGDRKCLLRQGNCSEVGGCPAHREWREASAPAFRFFERCTVADLLRDHAPLP